MKLNCDSLPVLILTQTNREKIGLNLFRRVFEVINVLQYSK